MKPLYLSFGRPSVFRFLLLLSLLCLGRVSRAQFTENFESASFPASWKVINVASGSTAGWTILQNQLGTTAYQGSRMAYLQGNVIGSSAPHDDYLITPAITVTAGVNDYLSFYARVGVTTAYSDALSIKVSTTGNDAADFRAILASNVKPTTSWSKYGYDLSAYAGKTIYVAIYNNTYDGGKNLYLDNAVSGPKPGAPAGCTDAPNGQYPSGTVSAGNCTGTPKVITDEGYAGEYSVVSLKGGVTYTFSSSKATDYITVSTTGRAVLKHGTTPVSYTPAADGNVRFYTHTNQNCGAESTNRTRAVVCGTPPPPVVNDEASGAVAITVGASCSGGAYSMSRATAAPNEPLPGCGLREDVGEQTLWFKFTAPASGAVKISTDFAGTSLDDPRMALYSATNPADYSTFTNLACDDDGGVKDGGWKSVIFCTGLIAGQTYYVQVEDYIGSSGNFCLEVKELTADMLSASTGCTPNSNSEFGSVVYKGWLSLTDDEGRLIALVKNSAGVPSSSTTELMHLHTGPVRKDGSGTYYLDRNVNLHNDNPGPYEVVLFFLQSELVALQAVSPATTLSSLNITRQTDTGCASDFDGTQGTSSLLGISSSGSTSDVAWVTFTTPGFSNFFIAGSTGALPVTWGSFTARASSKDITLQWTTRSEKNNTGFVIERSTDAVQFSRIGWKEGAGNWSGVRTYEFPDRTIDPGVTYYYRLRQVDADGKESVSVVRSAQVEGTAVRVGPNPAKEHVYLYFPGTLAGVAEVILLTGEGRIVRKWERTEVQNEPVPLGLSRIAPGLYFVQVRTAGAVYTRKLVVE